MAPRVYSVRFFFAFGEQVFTRYQVPEGRRAVVRNLTAALPQGETGYFWLYMNGLGVYSYSFQAPVLGVSFDCRQVAYAGEIFEVYTSNRYLNVAVSGYEFLDDGSGLGAAGEVTREKRPAAAPLPA